MTLLTLSHPLYGNKKTLHNDSSKIYVHHIPIACWQAFMQQTLVCSGSVMVTAYNFKSGRPDSNPD